MLTLHRLSLGYRVLYTGVLLFMTAGTAIHSVHQHVRTGVGPSAVAAWYRGNESDPDAAVMLFPRSFEETFGDAWLSITSYTLAFIVLGAILARSDAGPRAKGGLLAGYGLGAAFASAAPLLVRYASPAFAVLDTAALVAMPLIAVAISGVCIRDMWLRRSAGPRFDPARAL
jgi:hypothetical protein